ncbi:hypothetical protein B0H14DRAFT_742923 [Mycena olivaceomarginata]|nr:hypothetical protein B0H14DRAFT_742923 [Mycena olivaceomarginata]
MAGTLRFFPRLESCDHYFNKSADRYNIWNPDAEHSGFKGFVQPRSRDGSWFFGRADAGKVFRPDHCSPVYGHSECFGVLVFVQCGYGI